MCDFSGNLTAWLDHELPQQEAAVVERHLEGCSECRERVGAYERVRIEVDAFCNAVSSSNARPRVRRWAPVVAAAGAVAALVVLFLALPRKHAEPPPFHSPQVAVEASRTALATTVAAPAKSIQRVDRRRAVAVMQSHDENPAPPQNQNIYFPQDEPVIHIAIPAEEMFPPGAVPEGMHFAADLTIGADGSAERLRLRPRLAGFERRTVQP
jgi:anti-sigma factor RsiW